VRYLYIKRNVEKVWGARYLSKNMVLWSLQGESVNKVHDWDNWWYENLSERMKQQILLPLLQYLLFLFYCDEHKQCGSAMFRIY
jgi:hypothetical protein